MAKYPVFFFFFNRRALVVGCGPVAIRKAQTLLEAGARVVVVSERIDDIPAALSKTKNVELIKARYSKNYLAEATLVIAATNNYKVNKSIYKDCQQLEILCNVVDQPEFCDFFVPAVVKRGHLQVAIGTQGHCPAYAGHIRKKLEKILTDEHGQFLAELESLRKQVLTDIADPDIRKGLLGHLVDDDSFERFTRDGRDKWHNWARDIIVQHQDR